MQNNRWLQTLIILLVIIAATWLAAQAWGFIIQFSNILLLFFLSWLLSFILRPVARWLTARGLPYGASVAVVYLALAVVVTVSGFLLVPLITQQIEQLINSSGDWAGQLQNMANEVQKLLTGWGLKSADLDRIISDLLGQAQAAVVAVLQNTLPVLQSIATLVFQLIFLVLVSFYFMKDGDRLAAGMLRVLPPRWQDEVRLAALSIERSFGGFLRGQVVFAILYAIVTAIVMMIPPFQLDYVVIAAIAAGICMIIPLIGGLIAYFPPLLVALVTPGKPWWLLLLVLFIIQTIMINVLGPRIMSSAIGLHPIYVVAALMVGGQIAGIWGALFGIPVAGAINLIGRPLMRRIRSQSTLYQESSSRALPTSAFITGPLAASLAQLHKTEALSPPDVPPAQGETTTVTTTTTSTVSTSGTERPATPAHPRTDPALSATDLSPYLDDMEQDADELARRSPTLSARLWHLVILFSARAARWAWSKARRSARQRA